MLCSVHCKEGQVCQREEKEHGRAMSVSVAALLAEKLLLIVAQSWCSVHLHCRE